MFWVSHFRFNLRILSLPAKIARKKEKNLHLSMNHLQNISEGKKPNLVCCPHIVSAIKSNKLKSIAVSFKSNTIIWSTKTDQKKIKKWQYLWSEFSDFSINTQRLNDNTINDTKSNREQKIVLYTKTIIIEIHYKLKSHFFFRHSLSNVEFIAVNLQSTYFVYLYFSR